MPSTPPSIEDALARANELFPALTSLPAQLVERLRREARVMHVSAGTRVFDEHSPCSALPLVITGTIRVAKLAANGRELVLYRVTPGESCVVSSGCMIGHMDYNATGVAETEVTLIALPRALFADLVRASEAFRDFVFNVFGARLVELMTLVEEVAFRRLDQRLAAWLVARAPEVHIKQQALADELGSVREIISRLLNQFEDEHMVKLGRERIHVLDARRLSDIAQKGT